MIFSGSLRAAATEQVSIELTVADTISGTVEGAGKYAAGAEISIRAVPAAGFIFEKWTGSNGELLKQAAFTFRTATDRHFTAHFTRPAIIVTTMVEPAGGGTVSGAGRYTPGQQATLRATPAKGFIFTGWSDGKEKKPENIINFAAAADAVWTAHFVPVVMAKSQLAIAVEPAGAGSVLGAGAYPGGERVSLVAQPYEGYEFLCWRDAPVADLKQSKTTLLLTRDTKLTAVFAPKRVRLEIEISPKDAGVATGAGIYTENTRVNLVATPKPGWRFVRWEGPVGESEKARTLITCAGNVTLTAIFASDR